MSLSVNRCRGGVLLAAACLVFGAAGCCTFEKEWKAAQNACFSNDSLAGVWEGTWVSHVNGHHGSLRAIITPCGPNTYHARYKATFCALIPYGYETTHTTCDSCGAAYFSGKIDLGKCAGGEYSYWGLANGSMYEAGYRTEKDEGVFRMKKVGLCCGAATCRTLPSFDMPTPVPAPELDPKSTAPADPAASEQVLPGPLEATPEVPIPKR